MIVKICENLRMFFRNVPSFLVLPIGGTIFTHQLETLFNLTPSYHHLQQNQDMMPLFNAVNRWTPVWRYISQRTTHDEVFFFMSAVEQVMPWIDNNI